MKRSLFSVLLHGMKRMLVSEKLSNTQSLRIIPPSPYLMPQHTCRLESPGTAISMATTPVVKRCGLQFGLWLQFESATRADLAGSQSLVWQANVIDLMDQELTRSAIEVRTVKGFRSCPEFTRKDCLKRHSFGRMVDVSGFLV